METAGPETDSHGSEPAAPQPQEEEKADVPNHVREGLQEEGSNKEGGQEAGQVPISLPSWAVSDYCQTLYV